MSIERDVREASKQNPHVPIVIGSDYGGPEFVDDNPPVSTTRKFCSTIWKNSKEHADPKSFSLNVVLFFSGSIIQHDFFGVEVVRFSRKSSNVMVRVLVPEHLHESPVLIDFLFKSAREAVDLTEDVCAKKGAAFSADVCREILDRAEVILSEGGGTPMA